MEFFLFGFIIGAVIAALMNMWLTRIDEEADDSMYNTPDRIANYCNETLW